MPQSELLQQIRTHLEELDYEIKSGEDSDSIDAVLDGGRGEWLIHVAQASPVASLPDPNADTINSRTLPKGTEQPAKNPLPEAAQQMTLDLTWKPQEEKSDSSKEEKSESKKEEKTEEPKKSESKKEEPKKDESKKAHKLSGVKTEGPGVATGGNTEDPGQGETQSEGEGEEDGSYTTSFPFSDFEGFRHAMSMGVLETMTSHVADDEDATDDEIKTVLFQMSEAEVQGNVAFLAHALYRQMGGK